MAGSIGTAWLQVVPSTQGMQKIIDRDTNKDGPNSPANTGKKWSGLFKKGAKATLIGLGVTAAAGITKAFKDGLDARGMYEQLTGGAEKIFDEMDTSAIFADANKAWKTMQISANDYLASINDVGATFASTMGDERAYYTAKRGLQAISDYASGTGKDIQNLNSKFTMITRSTASYQSIADQFSGILPATSKGFLEAAQAAGFLEEGYKALTEVPIDQYQEAVSLMLEKGVADLNLTGNAAAEATSTLQGAANSAKAAWQNISAGTMSGEELGKALGTWVSKVDETLGQIFNTLVDEAPEIMQGFKEALAERAPNFEGVGEAIATAIREGLRKVAGKIEEILDNLFRARTVAINFALNGLRNQTFLSGLYEGMTPHATGLDYVPYDNYPALLHKGEMVLTKGESAAYRSGSGAYGSGLTIVQNINSVPQTPVELAAASRAYLENARWA